MTTVLLHTGQTAPKLQPRQPEVRVVRGGKHGLNRARQFASVMLHVIAAALLLGLIFSCLLYTSPSPRDRLTSRMPSSA